MTDVILDEGVTFGYPVLGGDKLYSLIPTLNDMFSLSMDEETYRDGIAQMGIDGFVTLNAINRSGELVYSFKNKSLDTTKVISDIEPKFSVYPDVSKTINFESELDFIKAFDINTVVPYNVINAPGLRQLKQLLSNYGYGEYPIIGESISLANLKVTYYGSGEHNPNGYACLINCPLVVILSIPTLDGFKEIILKTEKDV